MKSNKRYFTGCAKMLYMDYPRSIIADGDTG